MSNYTERCTRLEIYENLQQPLRDLLGKLGGTRYESASYVALCRKEEW